jgi:hypothetical protein
MIIFNFLLPQVTLQVVDGGSVVEGERCCFLNCCCSTCPLPLPKKKQFHWCNREKNGKT